MKNQEIFDFSLEFFKELDSHVSVKDTNRIIVTKVPYDFEKFVGKKTPYVLVFDTEAHAQVEDPELMTKGSYFLKAMRDYMQDKAQTSLLKLNIEVEEPSKEIKKDIKFNNCKLTDVTKTKSNGYIFRYTFASTCQYLNEKSQLINSLVIANNQILNADLDKFNVTDGSLQEVNFPDITSSYDIAKGEIKKLVSTQTIEIKKELQDKLTREATRLTEHYENQSNEDDEQMDYHIDKLKEAEHNLDRAYYDADKKKHRKRVQYHKDRISALKDKDYHERLQGEENRLVLDEIDRHSINIDNRLLNISVIYYPTYNFELKVEKGTANKKIKLSYNPILKKVEMPVCESCKKETKNVNLCSNNHVICDNCLDQCSDCKEDFCTGCLNKTCSKCKTKLCSKCVKKCPSCGKEFCKEHIKKCSICGKELCVDCLTTCPDCKKLVCKEHYKKCPSCGNQICEVCAKKDFVKCADCKNTVCSKCLSKCSVCDKVLCKEHTHKCHDCKQVVCLEHVVKCSVCKKEFSTKCVKKCQGCSKLVCKDDLKECRKCGSKICENCLRWKKRLFGVIQTQRCVKCEDK